MTPLRSSIAGRVNFLTQPFKDAGTRWGKFSEALNLGGVGKGLLGVGGAMGNVGGEAVGLGLKLAGTAAAAGLAFGAVVKGAMDAGDQLAEHADRVGLNVDAYASLSHSAQQADVDAQSFAEGLDKLNKNLGDMKVGKGGEFLSFLKEIDPTFAKQMQGAKSTEQALGLLTTAFQKLDDPSKRAKLSSEAFGKSGKQMGEWLHQGSAAIQEQQTEFMRLFGSQEKAARAAGELDNATKKTETAFLGLRMAAAGALFPALTKLANGGDWFLGEEPRRPGGLGGADRAEDLRLGRWRRARPTGHRLRPSRQRC